MTLRLVPTSQFKKDYKRAKKRGLDLTKLQDILNKLCAGDPLDAKHRDYALTGDYAGFREYHIQPD